MGMPKPSDKLIKNAKKKNKVKTDNLADQGEQSNVRDEEANQA